MLNALHASFHLVFTKLIEWDNIISPHFTDKNMRPKVVK